jgi:NACalpha-BTF3-like transcription factor
LTEFNPSKIKVNPKVKEFYKNAPEFDFGYESEEEEEEEEEISANDIKLIHYAYKG